MHGFHSGHGIAGLLVLLLVIGAVALIVSACNKSKD
jgi:hypothetical protein